MFFVAVLYSLLSQSMRLHHHLLLLRHNLCLPQQVMMKLHHHCLQREIPLKTNEKNILSLCFDKPRSLASPSNEFTSWVSSTITMTDEDNGDILTFWSQHAHLFPTIAGITRDILTIPASNTSVERLFSKSKNILTEKRTSVGLAKTDRLLFLVNNLGILKNEFDKNSTADEQYRMKRKKNEQMKDLLDSNPKKAKTDETNQFLD